MTPTDEWQDWPPTVDEPARRFALRRELIFIIATMSVFLTVIAYAPEIRAWVG